MKKAYIILSALLLVFIMLSGCKKDYSKEAQKFGEDFLKKAYTFQDTDKIIDFQSEMVAEKNILDCLKPLLTEESLNNKREYIGQMTSKIASVNRSNISLENIELKPIKNEEDNNLYYFDYTMTVKLTPLEEDKETQTADLSGKIFILHDNKAFKVDNIIPTFSNSWYILSYPENMREKFK